ncbi:uncharacterized protein LOC124366894 [Homalodisca vitripennis]|uniref:uncharacterized protein LOC124366894 n=1 Tax=Homalodisca vitripennis TaxID=197043 RepID=UPI001EECA7A9|nr:uncharacterized protein LOC124366894 [Homalodisca vitripennis]
MKDSNVMAPVIDGFIVLALGFLRLTLAQKIDDLSAKVDRLNDLPENVKLIQDDVKAIHDKFEQLEPRIERLEHRVSDIESRVDARLAGGSGFEETLMEINDQVVIPSLKGVICAEQHGFMKGRSTTTNLLAFQDHILTAFSESHQVDSIYTDFSKAFDRVSHEHLVAKLEAIGLSGSLLMWLKSYLRDRSLRVRVAGCLSKPFSATSGVPQGSLLGPVLFSIFINDLVQYTQGSKVLLFADDAKFFRTIKTLNDIQALQNSFDYRTAPIHDLRLQLNLMPLHTRRIINDLLFLRKLINSNIDAPDLLVKLDFRTS